MRRLLTAAAVLLVLLVVADRAGAALAGRAVAGRAQTAGGLAERPDVDVTGVPFLTQALGGRYERVEVTATGVPAGDVVLARLDSVLTGVRVPLSRALSGDVGAVPVERLTARALVPYGELSRDGLAVAPAGDRVRVTGTVEVLGRSLSAATVSRVEVVGGELVVTAESFEVGSDLADDLLTRAIGGRLDLRLPLTLPYGLQVTGVEVRPDGVVVRSAADDVRLAG